MKFCYIGANGGGMPITTVASPTKKYAKRRTAAKLKQKETSTYQELLIDTHRTFRAIQPKEQQIIVQA